MVPLAAGTGRISKPNLAAWVAGVDRSELPEYSVLGAHFDRPQPPGARFEMRSTRIANS